MPKRKNENSLEYIVKKLKYLEDQIKRSKRRRRRYSSTSSSSSSTETSQGDEYNDDLTQNASYLDGGSTDGISNDLLDSATQEKTPQSESTVLQTQPASPQPSTSQADTSKPPSQVAHTDSGTQPGAAETEDATRTGLSSDLLEILGVDPTTEVDHGPAINDELANRLSYIVSSGLKKEERKEFAKKYLIPENCQVLAAPILNAEIKAALTEANIKRDKALESRQQSVATVISCLSQAITRQFNSSEPDHELLQNLVDATRLLCDVQYNSSATRRYFCVNTLKKDLRDQLNRTKIGKHLFGDNLGETLKTAKAVNKSGSELKEQYKKPNESVNKNLNWRPTGGARGQAPAPSAQRRPPAAPAPPPSRPRHPPPPPRQPRPPATSSAASAQQPRHSRRR